MAWGCCKTCAARHSNHAVGCDPAVGWLCGGEPVRNVPDGSAGEDAWQSVVDPMDHLGAEADLLVAVPGEVEGVGEPVDGVEDQADVATGSMRWPVSPRTRRMNGRARGRCPSSRIAGRMSGLLAHGTHSGVEAAQGGADGPRRS